MIRRGTLAVVGGAMFATAGADAQTVAPRKQADAPEVYLLVASAGTSLAERYGHVALRVVDVTSGRDATWHWGALDAGASRSPFAILLRPQPALQLVVPTQDFLDSYARRARSVSQYRLNLTPHQASSLVAEVRRSARSDGGRYLYRFVSDNCSTRIRDLIDLAVDQRLRAKAEGQVLKSTWRDELVPPLSPSLLYQGLASLVLGRAGELPVDRWSSMFRPDRLVESLQDLAVTRDDRTIGPFVGTGEEVTPPVVSEPGTTATPAVNSTATSALIWLAPVALIGCLVGATRRQAWLVVRTAISVWYIASGILGTIIAIAWMSSSETLFRANLLLLAFSPLALLTGVAVWSHSSTRTFNWALRACLAQVLVALSLHASGLWRTFGIRLLLASLLIQAVTLLATRRSPLDSIQRRHAA